ncbi:hypothetical protein [Frankia sp. R82]|uniref:hypothetical protein n=1 Tax=Frankia sp. R82 TaxID=2950553 RepID=UPI002044112C|nr:hypothetical protein [Frankia sp. R82]MCM3885994.1 hypothetical protein [Frankia sp. R82]
MAGTEARDPAQLWSIAGSWPHAGPTFDLPPDPTPPPVPAGYPAGGAAVSASASLAVQVPGVGAGSEPAGLEPAGSEPAGLEPAGLEPAGLEPAESEDPWRAALRYRQLLGTSDVVRARAGRDAHHRRQGSQAQARRHREAAAEIRSRVEGVWGQVAEPLVQYGLTDLDQLRPTEPASTASTAGAVKLTKGGAPAGGHGAGDSAGRRRRRAARPLARSGHAGVGGTGGTAGADHSGGGLVDPRTAPRQAYELCLDAMSKAAELRAVSRGAASASAGLMTALASLLSLAVVGLLRVFAHAPGMPCIVGAALVAAGLVAAAAGLEVGVKPIARAGMLGAGCAAVAVLATFRLAPTDAVAVAGSLVALAAAARFGLGVGAPAEPPAQAGSRSGASRKG